MYRLFLMNSPMNFSPIKTMPTGTLVGFLLLLVSLPLSSQTNAGRILGSVSNQSGASLSNATVVITDMQRGSARKLKTDQSGNYAAPDLPPGTYKIHVQSQGFKSVDRPNVELQVAKDVRIDFDLQVGLISETVMLTGNVPLIETTNDTLGGTLSNRAINDLPLNGRDFTNLVVLRPGIVRYPGGGIGSISANGVRPEDNNFMVDGIDNNDPYFGQSVINGSGVQGTPATILPIDAIQEFNAQENPPAQFGWKPGATVNVGLKSGTNALHSTSYYFGRNAALDARNFFNPPPGSQQLRLHQFGATFGGPIVKSKFFFFGGYEGVRDLVGVTNIVQSPATVSLGGDATNSIPDAIAGVQGQALTVSPLSLKLTTLFPANNGTSSLGPTTRTTNFPNTNRGDNGLIKLDYNISDHHQLSGVYFIGDSLQTEQDQIVLQPQWESQAVTRGQTLGATWVWTPSLRWVNEARFGYNRLRQSFLTVDANMNPTGLGINTGVTSPLNFGMPEIVIAGFLQTATGGIFGGNSGWPQILQPAQTFQFTDNITHSSGKHIVAFGGEARRSSVDHLKNRLGKGRINFVGDAAFAGSTPLEDFFAGAPTSGRIFLGNSRRHVSFWSYGAFIQDDWHVSKRFAVNLGVRYELNTVIKEVDNLLGNFDFQQGLVQVGKQISSPYNGDHNNFAPRVGFAWDLRGNGKTVIRAGGGVMYEIPHFDAFIGQFNLNNDPGTIGINIVPTGALGVSPAGGTINAGVQNVPGGNLNWTTAGPVFNVASVDCSAAPCDTFAVNRNLRTPYVTNWNLNIQEALASNLSLQVGYVGNHATKLLSIYDINQVNQNSAAEITCGHCEQAGRPFNSKFPFLGVINQLGNGYESNYQSLQTTLTLRSTHGLSLLLGYTWSHALDQASDNRAPEAMDALRPNLEYGSSDMDIRHRLALSTTYVIPGKKSPGQLLQGWQLNSIVTLQSGQPWNVVAGSDFSQTGEGGERWDFFGNPSDFKARPGGIPCFGFGGTPPCVPAIPAACTNAATKTGATSELAGLGCYAVGNSVLIPPLTGKFGTMGRNIFRGPALYASDLSVVKNWKFADRATIQLRAEFFNVLNHPNLANPYGVNNTFGRVDATVPGQFGCACATPDVADANPVIGTGGPRNVQLGFKIIF